MKKIETYAELREHLFAVIEHATDDVMCKKNHSISKGKFWSICLSACDNNKDDAKCGELISSNVLTEFPEYLRIDFK